MRRRIFAVVSVLAVVVSMMAAAMAGNVAAKPIGDQGGRPLSTVLSGASEVPGTGDPDGSGSARLTLNVGQGEICYALEVEGIEPATAAHIHVGSADVAGPVVVELAAPTDGSSSSCEDANRELIKNIFQNPENYYVNVHNPDFPAGAVRGQLG